MCAALCGCVALVCVGGAWLSVRVCGSGVLVVGARLFTAQCWVQASQLKATYTYGTHKITQVFFSTKVSFSGIVAAGLFY